VSRIEWTDKTINCVTGCTQVSMACDHCYARIMAEQLQRKLCEQTGVRLQDLGAVIEHLAAIESDGAYNADDTVSLGELQVKADQVIQRLHALGSDDHRADHRHTLRCRPRCPLLWRRLRPRLPRRPGRARHTDHPLPLRLLRSSQRHHRRPRRRTASERRLIRELPRLPIAART